MTEDKWVILHQEERILNEKEETLLREEKQLIRIEENCESHFHHSYRLFDELRYLFRQSEDRFFYETKLNEFSEETRKVMRQLDEGKHELMQQRKKVEQQLEDVTYEKQKVALAEEEHSK